MNTPISFELAKLLKEKGFNELTVLAYDSTGELPMNHKECYIKGDWNNNRFLYSAPTIGEVVMWLYEKHGIWIWVTIMGEYFKWFGFYNYQRFDDGLKNSPTEAYSKAIEYVLNNLI